MNNKSGGNKVFYIKFNLFLIQMELEKEEKEEISIEDLLEKKYKKFYKASVVSITILYIYINENNLWYY